MRWDKLRNGMLPTKRLQHPPGEVQCAGVLGRAACLARKAVKSSGITGCCLAKGGSKIRRERCRGRWEAFEAKLVLNVAFWCQEHLVKRRPVNGQSPAQGGRVNGQWAKDGAGRPSDPQNGQSTAQGGPVNGQRTAQRTAQGDSDPQQRVANCTEGAAERHNSLGSVQVCERGKQAAPTACPRQKTDEKCSWHALPPAVGRGGRISTINNLG